MSTTERTNRSKKTKKRIVPRASKGQSLKAAMVATNKQYAGTLAKLAR